MPFQGSQRIHHPISTTGQLFKFVWDKIAPAIAIEEATIVAQQGRVEILYSGQTKWVSLKPGTKLHAQDSVKTLEDSSVDIELADNIIRLKENSVIELGDIEKQKQDIKITQIKVSKGKILALLKNIPSDTKFNIISPVAVLGIRGTSFSAAIMPDSFSTELKVAKGEVIFGCRAKIDKFTKVGSLGYSIISPWELAEIGAEGKGILSRKILGEKVLSRAASKHLLMTQEDYSSEFGALARITTERSAQIDAYRRLAEIMYGTIIDSKTTLEDYAIKNDTIRTTVKGVVKGAKVIETRYYSDGAISVDMKIKSKKIVDQLIPITGDIFGSNYLASPEVIQVGDFEDYLEIIELNTDRHR